MDDRGRRVGSRSQSGQVFQKGLHRRTTTAKGQQDVQKTDVLSSEKTQVLGGALATAQAEETLPFGGRTRVFGETSKKRL